MSQALFIKGGCLVDPSRGINRIGNLLVLGDSIVYEGEGVPEMPQDTLILHANNMIVCPGFIDLHCHLREPGFENKETIATGIAAAARGGYSTICCMPNTDPPIDSGAIVEYVTRKAAQESSVHVLPVGCITRGRKGLELADMDELARAGVIAFSDDGASVTNSQLMCHAMDYSRALGVPIVSHCEDTTLSNNGVMHEGWVSTMLGLKGIPSAAEEIMLARDLILAELTHAKLHVAHVSTQGSVDLLRQAKEKGLPVTAEVTPHHLTLTEESVIGKQPFCLRQLRQHASSREEKELIPLFYNSNAKVSPPLRTAEDIEHLIIGLREGVIDAIATDHAPHTLADKNCDMDKAAFGISGFETALGCLMSLVHSNQLSISLLISKLTCEPAKIIGRGSELGTLKEGSRANITIFDPDSEWEVDGQNFVSRGKNTPFHGYSLKGKVMATIINGRIAYRDSSLPLPKPFSATKNKERGEDKK